MATARPATSTVSGASVGGGGGGGRGAGSGAAGYDPDFLSKPWLQALQEADCTVFDGALAVAGPWGVLGR